MPTWKSEEERWEEIFFFLPNPGGGRVGVPRWYLFAAGQAQQRLLAQLNSVARDHFLSNILIERRNDYGINAPLRQDLARLKLDALVRACAVAGVEGLSELDKENRAFACEFGVAFQYKTGPWAERLGKRDVAGRLSAWNGAGRVVRNGKVVADAANHANKVMAVRRALSSDPRNQAACDVFRAYGGVPY